MQSQNNKFFFLTNSREKRKKKKPANDSKNKLLASYFVSQDNILREKIRIPDNVKFFTTPQEVKENLTNETLQELIESASLKTVLEKKLASKENEISTLRYIQSLLPLKVNEIKNLNSFLASTKESQEEKLIVDETINFLRSQLLVSNQKLIDSQILNEEIKRHNETEKHAFNTISFLFNQLRSLKKTFLSEKENKKKLNSAIDILQKNESELLQKNLELFREKKGFQEENNEEKIIISVMERELQRRDLLIKGLKQEILLKDELLEGKEKHINDLKAMISMYKRVLSEIRSAFSPLTDLLIKKETINHNIDLLKDNIAERAYNDVIKPQNPAFSADKNPNYEDILITQNQKKSKIFHLHLNELISKKTLQAIRWGKISMLGIFFIFITFGTTDLFSSFKPIEIAPSTELWKTLPVIPKLFSFPFLNQTVSHSFRKVETALQKSNIVVLDPGHGGQDPGAINSEGFREKDFTLDISLRIEKYLKEKGRHVILTRRSDKYLSLLQRSNLANCFPNSLFVSIHFNSHPPGSTGKANGFSVFYNDDSSKEIATRIYNSAMHLTSLHSYNDGVIDGRSFYREANHLGVLKHLKNPGVLVETCFLSHKKDFKMLTNDLFREQLSVVIADGIEKCSKERQL